MFFRVQIKRTPLVLILNRRFTSILSLNIFSFVFSWLFLMHQLCYMDLLFYFYFYFFEYYSWIFLGYCQILL